MSFYSTHYQSGEEICAGDRVAYAGSPGRVVLVINSEDIPKDWASMGEWLRAEYETGFMLNVESMGLLFMHESNEDLDLLGRSE